MHEPDDIKPDLDRICYAITSEHYPLKDRFNHNGTATFVRATPSDSHPFDENAHSNAARTSSICAP